MTDINIYKNFNMSLAEIHRAEVLKNEVIETDYLLPKELTFAQKFIRAFLLAFFGFGAVAVAVILIIKPFEPDLGEGPVIEEIVQTPIVPPNSEYVQLQIIEFADSGTANIPANNRDTTPDIEVLPSLAPKQTTPVTPPAEPVKTVPEPLESAKVSTTPAAVAKPAGKTAVPAVAPKYSLEITGGSSTDYSVLRDLATRNTIKFTADRVSSTQKMWVVYANTAGAGVFLEGTEVSFQGSFATKEEALVFAQNMTQDSDTTAILRMEDRMAESYTINLCCTELDKAKLIAQESGITDKVIRIQKK